MSVTKKELSSNRAILDDFLHEFQKDNTGNIYVIYHKEDHDGHCSAMIVMEYFIELGIQHSKNIKFIATDYNMDFSLNIITKNDIVIMLDFSTNSLSDMVYIDSISKRFIWIDHHHEIIDKVNAIDYFISGVQDIRKAACQLTWKYFFPTKKCPKFVDLIGFYDTYEFKATPGIVEFHFGLLSEQTDITELENYSDSIWPLLMSDEENTIDQLTNDGMVIQKYQEKEFLVYAKKSAEEIQWLGETFLCVNYASGGAWVVAGLINPKKHTAVLVYGRRKGGWHVSMYKHNIKNKFNLGKVAVEFGGGGSRDSAGFSWDSSILPWNTEK